MYPQRFSVPCLVALVSVAACSSDKQATKSPSGGKTEHDSGTAGTDGSTPSTPSKSAGRGPDGRITKECQGFPLDGIKYSPGGTTLPNKCAPFDATTNNPYAVRCVDALPAYKTRFAGDEYCILPPPEDKGLQVGLHPQGADYWNQMWAGDMSGYDSAAGDWVMHPGMETAQNYLGGADNTDPQNYYRTYFRMRTGSHHNIITMHEKGATEGWRPSGNGEALPGLFDSSVGKLVGVLGGQQRPDDGQPASLDKPTEDAGLYLKWPASPAILFNMHHINTTENDILREGWVNIWWESDATIAESWFMGMGNDQIAMNIPPGKTVDYHYSWTVGSTPTRLVRLFGHRHFWTTNFSAWVEHADGAADDVVYQSFDWAEMPTYRYDSQIDNPTPDATTHKDGAQSGVLTLNPGDKLHFNCHTAYTDEQAATNSAAPTPEANGNLHFANETFKAEMCIGFGNVTGGYLGLPTRDQSPVPDFAQK